MAMDGNTKLTTQCLTCSVSFGWHKAMIDSVIVDKDTDGVGRGRERPNEQCTKKHVNTNNKKASRWR